MAICSLWEDSIRWTESESFAIPMIRQGMPRVSSVSDAVTARDERGWGEKHILRGIVLSLLELMIVGGVLRPETATVLP